MKAIIVKPPRPGAEITEIQRTPGKGPVLVKIVENGICGTDREIVNGTFSGAQAPPNEDYLILGHEAIGVVEKIEKGVEDLEVGDLVMPINRRGCGHCLNCLVGRPDFCETGGFVEAGITGMHGFMVEYFYDDPKYLVKVPKAIADIAILAQPLSDLEKSIEEILTVQRRVPVWTCDDGTYNCRTALVIGSGAIGTLVTLLLRTYGFKVIVANRRDPTPREKEIFFGVGAKWYNSANGYEELARDMGGADIIFDTTGRVDVVKSALTALRINGILGLFGFSEAERAEFTSADLKQLIYRNIAVVGLDNGQKPHFQQALVHLAAWKAMWPDVTSKLITRVVEINNKDTVLDALRHRSPGEIKIKISWQ
ncbi:MAG: glucose 1-dehydrogenase [Candidatus Aramenus sulfurataquae]|jgi:aldose 1-dehydrogenase [NAD(P)+]|uniref:Glucose 1-dehydrogenase n=1 Tax=Candidatus Aramenus sulfurataquae TaxID=1326980 RepID=W7KJD1_9CREN|nr:MAG: glucose 1-dehydrogenase [Candidatus Aramenus sulfurataquae]